MKKNKQTNWSGKSRGGGLGYAFFVYLIKLLGVRFAYLFLSLIVVYFIPFAPKATSAIWYYNRKIRRCGVCRSLWELYTHYYVLGQTIIDKMAIGCGLQNQYRFHFENYQQFIDKLNAPEGAILISAHVGCWEIGGSFFGDYASKMNIVMYDAEYQKIKQVLDKNCHRVGYKIIPVNEGGIESILRIKQVLDKGEYLCFQGDRFINRDNLIEKEFMGKKAFFPAGPFLIAEKFKVPVIFYFAMRESHRTYRFLFSVIERDEKISRDQFLDYYLKEVEKAVSNYPQQWFNFYKFWS